jgi:fermentation-respiration switch protein FrsA (DUF1100 family)
MRQALADEELRLFAGAPPVCVPVVAEPGAPAAIPQAGTSAHLLEAAEHAPSWRNEITLSSLGRLIEYAPGNSIEHISPTPLLMLIAGDDVLTPPDLALAAYNRALEPKQLAFIETDVHHGVYDEPARGDAIAAARDWFTRHLLSGADVPVGAQER